MATSRRGMEGSEGRPAGAGALRGGGVGGAVAAVGGFFLGGGEALGGALAAQDGVAACDGQVRPVGGVHAGALAQLAEAGSLVGVREEEDVGGGVVREAGEVFVPSVGGLGGHVPVEEVEGAGGVDVSVGEEGAVNPPSDEQLPEEAADAEDGEHGQVGAMDSLTGLEAAMRAADGMHSPGAGGEQRGGGEEEEGGNPEEVLRLRERIGEDAPEEPDGGRGGGGEGQEQCQGGAEPGHEADY